jgi:hypothetical protein
MTHDTWHSSTQRTILVHVLLSHLMWGSWSVIQASLVCEGEFDFLIYAKKRFQAFAFHSQEFLPMLSDSVTAQGGDEKKTTVA